jgi:hypothetical protein
VAAHREETETRAAPCRRCDCPRFAGRASVCARCHHTFADHEATQAEGPDAASPAQPSRALPVSAGRGPVGLSIAFTIGGALILVAGLALYLAAGRPAPPAGAEPVYLHAPDWVQRPSVLPVGTDAQVTQLRWTGWGGATATGQGTIPVNDCKPDCSSGTVRPAVVTVIASKLRTCASRKVYTRVEVHVHGPTSAAVPVGFEFRCSGG